MPNAFIVRFINNLIESLNDLAMNLVELDVGVDPPAEPVPPPAEPVPPPVIIPIPPTARMGVGYDFDDNTVFPEPRHPIHLRADGTGHVNTLQEAAQAFRNDPTIDEIRVSGPIPASQGRFTVIGPSRERPLVVRGVPNTNAKLPNVWSDAVVGNLAFVGLHLQNPRFYKAGANMLFERVLVSGQGDGLVMEIDRPQTSTALRWSNITLRLSRVLDNARPVGKSQGLFFAGVDDWLCEDTVFDQNGWIPPREASTPSGFDQLRSHSAYIAQPGGPGVVRRCVFMRPASHGIQMRGGGELIDCVFIDCPIAWGSGYDYASDTGEEFGEVDIQVEGCVAVGASDVAGGNPRGMFGIVSHFSNAHIQDCAAVLNGTNPTNNVFLTVSGGTVGSIHVYGCHTHQWGTTYRNPPDAIDEADCQWEVPTIRDTAYLQSLRGQSMIDILRDGFANRHHALAFVEGVQSAAAAL